MLRIVLTAESDLPFTYHNITEWDSGRSGLTLQRIPRAWRERFPERTAFRATQAAGVELRFCAQTRYIALELATDNQIGYNAAVALYHGYRNVSLVSLSTPRYAGKVVLLDREEDIPDALQAPWRILCPYGALTILKALSLSDGAEILPAPARRVRWLAHGDSITHGAHALHPGFTYVNLVADGLGWDAINMGFGGSAWGDAAVAEYIAARNDWDILSIAIGTNTYGGQTEPATAFGQRYDRFLEIVRQAHLLKPIVCLTPFWRGQDTPPAVANSQGSRPQDYRDAISTVVTRRMTCDPHLALLHGTHVIGDERGLTVDRLHPDAHGMARIAQHLAPVLRKIL
jgi:lysophospholipase L1-like esterase